MGKKKRSERSRKKKLSVLVLEELFHKKKKERKPLWNTKERESASFVRRAWGGPSKLVN